MRILLVTTSPFLSEPLGAMILSATCRAAGHEAKLIVGNRKGILPEVQAYKPDVVGYSAMSTTVDYFRKVDADLRDWMTREKRLIFRIMGGPHPTYFPQIIDEMGLDAICQGDGDHALPSLLDALAAGRPLEHIPNIALTAEGPIQRELVDDLDNIPFADRADYYNAVRYCRQSGLRSFIASRGCPYNCTYCFNHAFNKMFKGCGSILRRRSVESLIVEIEKVVKDYPPVRLIRFSDDTFVYRADDWLEEFVTKYRARVNLPFYCLMRSNTLSEDTARLLSEAGCKSMSMSLESGSEAIRNGILKRGLNNEVVKKSFEVAKKYKIRVFANSMLGIPGTKLEDDWQSVEFARNIRPSAPFFTICSPYPQTEIWQHAVDDGHLDPTAVCEKKYTDLSELKTYSDEEKRKQALMCYLGPMYCSVPSPAKPLLKMWIESGKLLKVARKMGLTYANYRMATRIIPQAIPRTPSAIATLIRDSFKTL